MKISFSISLDFDFGRNESEEEREPAIGFVRETDSEEEYEED